MCLISSYIRDGIYEDVSDRYVRVSGMDSTQVTGGQEPAHGWTSDEQEMFNLVEDFITQDAVPAEVKQTVVRLQESRDSHEALRVILNSLD